jgi:cell division protein FtsI/penicillin-binding protein 2
MKKWAFIIIAVLALSSYGVQVVYTYYHQQKIEALRLAKIETLKSIRSKLDESFHSEDGWPTSIWSGGEEYFVEYTFNQKLSRKIRRLLRRYRSDYAAVVVIDNETGEILSAEGFERDGLKFNERLPFTSTHPAASIIKLVTSAELIENSAVEIGTRFKYRGRGTTLYKYQLKPVPNRRTRSQTFKTAFAYSNNVIFGKAAINESSGVGLFNMANEFGFNQKIMDNIDLSPSIFNMPDSNYNLAEMASGFNRKTMISPVHAAAMATVVPNNGIMKLPRVVNQIKKASTGEVVWSGQQKAKPVVSPETAQELGKLMESTVGKGTARRSFSRLPYRLKKKLKIGGKTGTLSGGVPYGRRDWFVSYATPKDERFGTGISVAVMNINLELWYVKSAYLAKEIVQYYYTVVNPMDEEMAVYNNTSTDEQVNL